MKKRIISIILAISFLFSLVPAVLAEEKSAEPKSIEAQIRAYADSVYQDDAVTSAAMVLASHGMFGGGKTLQLDDSSAMASLLLNSNQFQYWLVKGCSGAIRNMQKLDMSHVPYLRGWCNWNSTENQTGLNSYQDQYYDNRDWYVFGGNYTGGWNSCDRALEWMTGIAAEYMQITRVQVLENSAVYQIDLSVWDSFDFHTANNTGFKDFFSGFGMLMFQEFEWVCHLSFTLEVPYSCPHGPKAYRWTYDDTAKTMTSQTGGAYSENKAESRVAGESVHYYALQEPVRLLHDRSWVLEYDVKNPRRIPLTSFDFLYSTSKMSYQQISGESILLHTKSYDPPDTQNGAIVSETVYNSTQVRLSSISSDLRKTLLTYRLENQVYPDGSNMVFLTITDPATGTVWAEKIPMNDYYESRADMDNPVLLDEESDWVSGRDLYINYIGNRSFYFGAGHFELRIWEDTAGQEDYYRAAEPVPATCTEPGYTDQICAACGHSIREYGEPARGHRYEVAVTAPGCTEDGFTTYTCECGDSYIADPTEALGHEMGAWQTELSPTCTGSGTEQRQCLRCALREQRSLDPLGHDLTDWTVTEAPSCTESGLEERWCLRCEVRESRTAPALGHSYEAVVTEPGCTTGGYTDYICACGERYRSDYTSPRGHRYESKVTEPTCTAGGYTTYTCACGDSYRSDYTSPVGHQYEAVVTEPTCTAGGYTTYTCECGDSYRSDYTTALGHEYAEGICARCGDADPNYKAPAQNPFTDVPAGSFFETPVLWALENGITSGATADTFNPNGSCMRAQVVTFLWRAAGQPEPTSMDNPFVDVAETDFYYKAILWAVENGITNGSDATHFNPFGICNRAQVVTFLYRAFGSPAVENEANPFTDVPGEGWYTAPVLWAVDGGITNGLSADSFGPNSPCNRAQVVTFLHRAYN